MRGWRKQLVKEIVRRGEKGREEREREAAQK